MRKYIIALFCFFSSFASCQSISEINGAWALKETYYYWKSGKSEEIDVTEIRISGAIYYILTNSIVIDSNACQPYFSVPGAKWKIVSIFPKGASAYILKLESFKRQHEYGEILIIKNTDSSICFIAQKMSGFFIKEFSQSFLLTGRNNSYVLCDIKN